MSLKNLNWSETKKMVILNVHMWFLIMHILVLVMVALLIFLVLVRVL